MRRCSCSRPFLVDYGPELGRVCEFCIVPQGAELKPWLAGFWLCPVCDCQPFEAKQLVIHHDHFPDALYHLLRDPALRNLCDDLETFCHTRMCGACNSLDSAAKLEIPKLPRWFSLSPDDMRRARLPDGTPDLEIVRAIWDEKRAGIIADRCRQLWTHGIPKEDIKNALASYKTVSAIKAEKRATMSQRVAEAMKVNREFVALFEQPDNDLALVVLLLGLTWQHSDIKAFVHHYHRRHRDPQLERRPAEFGPEQFKAWLLLEATDKPAADRYRQNCRFWRERSKTA